MEYRILGPLEVSAGAGPLPLGGAKPRALMAMLLLHANQSVSAERLAVALWGEDTSGDVGGNVRVLVSRVRRLLPDPGALATTPAGYRLSVVDGELDAQRFEALVAEGRAALRERRFEAAVARLREAVGLWRGPALADFALEAFAQTEAARLEELRLAALEAQVDAELALGRHAELASELRVLAAAHPLREQLTTRLMLALYRSGRQAEALAVYGRARAALVEQLGLEPGSELRRMQEAILAHDPALEADRPDERAPEGLGLPHEIRREAEQGPFVGRAAALERLRARTERAFAGERQFVVVAGEPGIGKTRLACEFARERHAAGATVLSGRCEVESIVPYQPFIAALAPYLDGMRAAPEELGPELRELARFLPALQRFALPEPAPADDPQIQRYRLHEAVIRVLAHAARARPTVLALDDLQWADAATALLLGHVLGAPPARLLVLATVREDGEPRAAALAELLARQRRDAAFEWLELRGLDEAETGELAHISSRGARELRERTEGNPLFIRELLRSVPGDEPDLEQALRRSAVPDGVKELIALRLARLGGTVASALALGSVMGREFRGELVETLLGEPEGAVLDALEQAAGAGLVRESADDPGRLVFSHALVQEALYERQSAARRARAHQRVGEALAATDAKAGEIAHHLALAGSPDARRYTLLAAREAMGALAFEEAAEHYRRALAALGEEEERLRCELLLALAGAERGFDGAAARVTYGRAAEVARRAGLTEHFAQAALGFPNPWAEGSELDSEAVALLEEALVALGEGDDPLVVKLRARLASVLYLHAASERLLALTGEALAMARRVGDPQALVVALESRHSARFDIAHLDERLQIADELLALARRDGAREVEALAQHRRIYDLLELGDVAAAREAHRELARLAQALRQPLLLRVAECFEVVWAELEDRLQDAWAHAEEALRLATLARSPAAADHVVHQFALLHRLGALGEHVDAVAASAGRAPRTYRAALCLARLQAGQRAAARAEFEALADGFAEEPRDIMWFTIAALLAQMSALLDDRERAAALYPLLLPYRDRSVQVALAVHWGSAEYFLGLLAETGGDAAAALEHYETALARNTAAGLRYRAAQARARVESVGAGR